ncbi:MAG TPA: tRNA (adenosine(37)-N6)-threonylcarbamoyltransferase complex dimerization subunit type 1 TsaB [Candidatus Eremiobacteraceae bacterium]|nr:tRNA (adenosine(37)-N6)-threonylcarbamoyltransferase complex dimerization subunit type 1 TsaB [Candidatus Eremiobacteraceae bacterium]
MTRPGTVVGIHTGGRVEVAVQRGDAAASDGTDRQALEGVLPLVRRCLEELQTDVASIEAVAACCGPGSFTGLRIGVAFAKSLAQALDVPAIGVSAFDVEAALREEDTQAAPAVVVVEGKREFYYARIYSRASRSDFLSVAGTRDEIAAAARDSLGEASGAAAAAQAIRGSVRAIGSRARAVVKLGTEAIAAGAAADWRSLAIDYGQRPNAVVNWERRHGRT